MSLRERLSKPLQNRTSMFFTHERSRNADKAHKSASAPAPAPILPASRPPVDAPSEPSPPPSIAAMNSVKLVTHRDDAETDVEESRQPSPSPALEHDTADEQEPRGDDDDGPDSPPNESSFNGRSPRSPSSPERLVLPRANAAPSISAVRMISSEFGGTKSHSNLPVAEDSPASNGNGAAAAPQWSSAVGRANLGKSGRVIEKLMGDKDMLKRDLQIERLHAEEARQAVKMTEERIGTLSTDYESRLHEATINKMLLKKRERQLADIKDHIGIERQRADEAVEQERVWKNNMQNMEAETKKKVDEATSHAMLMEGRCNTLTSHWKEQGEAVDRAAKKLRGEITSLVQERLKDVERIDALQQICNEQRDTLARLEEDNKAIVQATEAYKTEKDASLVSIRTKALEQEAANETTLAEAQKTLNELRWALGVKRNVKDAG